MTPSQATAKNSKSALKDKNKTSPKTPSQPPSLLSVGAIKKEPVNTEVGYLNIKNVLDFRLGGGGENTKICFFFNLILNLIDYD